MTEYVVLKKQAPEDQGDWTWLQGPIVEANSPEGAVRKALGDSTTGGVYVGVPVRSFKPLTIKVKVERTVQILGEGEGNLIFEEVPEALEGEQVEIEPEEAPEEDQGKPEPDPEDEGALIPPRKHGEAVPEGARY